MNKEYRLLSRQLKKMIAQMKKLQTNINADQQPISMHEVDELKRLGEEYAQIMSQLSSVQNSSNQQTP